MSIRFHGLPTAEVQAAKKNGLDAYGGAIETHVSKGAAYPCRHCLGETLEGEDYLILAWRPFETTNAYAETGPIFLCAAECKAATPSSTVPDILRAPRYLVRGYSTDERIVYGTGEVVPTADIPEFAETLLNDPQIAFVDVRSASNNCFQCRVCRA
ncbi:DUF1203 domain-containing protein [Roseovarius sp. 2305UL8-3]|uniref:DUF1203 domain-containing protein n=1 Tax=Roseovarius conchicola TaxID=3121636 RepID=UPI003529507F